MTEPQPEDPKVEDPKVEDAKKQKPSRAQKRRALLSELQILLASLIILGLVLLPAIILLNQHSGRELLTKVQQDTNNSQSILNFILDCTTPKGICYRQGQANTAATIGKVEDIIVLAAVCAKQPQNTTVEEIRNCVEKGLGH